MGLPQRSKKNGIVNFGTKTKYKKCRSLSSERPKHVLLTKFCKIKFLTLVKNYHLVYSGFGFCIKDSLEEKQ
ncbi:hypothetical protein BpHYR1_043407 [Brachionus plicatilis]|uniref:Uncharacterized protein n=1 Tax=Brachionus plicatilis TaxID=10195 RepID=A0A3M7SP09_BRAPC|nr:hypothetical protein BpHYR1_043407 [Brachionus plicatilis]